MRGCENEWEKAIATIGITERYRNEESADSVNPDNDPYDDVMDIYADKLDANSENYDLNEGDEDDI